MARRFRKVHIGDLGLSERSIWNALTEQNNCKFSDYHRTCISVALLTYKAGHYVTKYQVGRWSQDVSGAAEASKFCSIDEELQPLTRQYSLKYSDVRHNAFDTHRHSSAI
jgi:hypothetical protein